MSNKPTASKPTRRQATLGRAAANAGEARRGRADAARRASVPGKAASKPKAAPAKKGARALGTLSSLDVPGLITRFRTVLLAVVAVIVVLVALYGPTRGLYVAWRDNAALRETLDEENKATEQYQSDVNSLLTEEGIKDEARKKGYVGEGEKSIVVDGETAQDEPEEEADEPLPWYLAVTDFIFQYSEQGEE